MFGSNFKWVEKQITNFLYLTCYKIELFSTPPKKIIIIKNNL